MKTTLPIQIIAIEDDGFHLLTSVTLNGKPASMIIDTGASRSVFDENRIVQFLGHNNLEEHDRLSSGLGTNTMTSKKVKLDNLTLGDLQLVNYDATILDLGHVNTSYEKLELEPVDGILGGDILKDYQAIIDYAGKVLVLSMD
ncbi:MAG: clan AA aspartic protease [Flavobacteriales bacterium]|nr:clan AA aspartic protease [Flavobacteriales bacterium]